MVFLGRYDLAKTVHYDARELAGRCGLSIRQLERRFLHEFGSSPQQWLDQQRLIAAKEKLLAGEPVKNVSADLGFKQPSHFCRKFKAFHKVTPTEFITSFSATAIMSLTDNKCRSGITTDI